MYVRRASAGKNCRQAAACVIQVVKCTWGGPWPRPLLHICTGLEYNLSRSWALELDLALSLALPNSVTLGKLHNLLKPQFPHRVERIKWGNMCNAYWNPVSTQWMLTINILFCPHNVIEKRWEIEPPGTISFLGYPKFLSNWESLHLLSRFLGPEDSTLEEKTPLWSKLRILWILF